ncbi:MAG: hypothetical protein CM15mV10_2330 [uncultured marine virus]|nr:MAG: hypothetical protein CM15mV10_2330 [uncultured marine virus]
MPFPTANGVGGAWKSLEYKMSYLVEDLAHTTSSLVKITDGKYLDIVVGKYVKTEDLTVKIDNFLTVIYSQVISAMRQATSTLATSLQVEGYSQMLLEYHLHHITQYTKQQRLY